MRSKTSLMTQRYPQPGVTVPGIVALMRTVDGLAKLVGSFPAYPGISIRFTAGNMMPNTRQRFVGKSIVPIAQNGERDNREKASARHGLNNAIMPVQEAAMVAADIARSTKEVERKADAGSIRPFIRSVNVEEYIKGAGAIFNTAGAAVNTIHALFNTARKESMIEWQVAQQQQRTVLRSGYTNFAAATASAIPTYEPKAMQPEPSSHLPVAQQNATMPFGYGLPQNLPAVLQSRAVMRKNSFNVIDNISLQAPGNVMRIANAYNRNSSTETKVPVAFSSDALFVTPYREQTAGDEGKRIMYDWAIGPPQQKRHTAVETSGLEQYKSNEWLRPGITFNRALIEHFTINVKDSKEGIKDLKRKVEEALLEILNTVTYN